MINTMMSYQHEEEQLLQEGVEGYSFKKTLLRSFMTAVFILAVTAGRFIFSEYYSFSNEGGNVLSTNTISPTVLPLSPTSYIKEELVGVNKFSEIDTSFILNKYFPLLPKDINTIKDKNWGNLKCFDFSGSEASLPVFSVVSKEINDENLITTLENIELSLLTRLSLNEAGKLFPKNIPQKALYNAICFDENNYYILYDTLEKKSEKKNIPVETLTASTSARNKNLLVKNKTEDLNFSYPYIPENSERIFIKKDDNQGTNQTVHPVASESAQIKFFGCDDIIGILQNRIFLVCGGEYKDQLATSLFTVNVNENKVKEVAICTNLFSEKEGYKLIKCYDENGNLYTTKIL